MCEETNFTVVSSAEELRQAARAGSFETADTVLQRYTSTTSTLSKLLPAVLAATDDMSGNTALHLCSANGHLDIVTLLVEHEAPINATNHSGSTPLHYASLTGQLEIVQKLIGHGAKAVVENQFGRTALDEAHIGRHSDVANLLISHVESSGTSGADICNTDAQADQAPTKHEDQDDITSA